MLSPKRTKFRKQMKGKNRGLSYRASDVDFGDYGLQVLEPGRITSRQIEAARMAIQRATKRQGKLFIRIFPDKPVTKKPLETRMGKGKGSVEEWVALVQPGRMLYELEGVTEAIAREAFKLAGIKLPLPTRFMKRESASAIQKSFRALSASSAFNSSRLASRTTPTNSIPRQSFGPCVATSRALPRCFASVS